MSDVANKQTDRHTITTEYIILSEIIYHNTGDHKEGKFTKHACMIDLADTFVSTYLWRIYYKLKLY